MLCIYLKSDFGKELESSSGSSSSGLSSPVSFPLKSGWNDIQYYMGVTSGKSPCLGLGISKWIVSGYKEYIVFTKTGPAFTVLLGRGTSLKVGGLQQTSFWNAMKASVTGGPSMYS